MIRIERVLLPIDFSDPCWAAAQYACELATRFDAGLDLLHVTESPIMAMPSPGAPLPAELVADTTEDAQRELGQWHASAFDELPNVSRQVVQGTPFVEIVRFAREHNNDLIVIGTHGRTGASTPADRQHRGTGCPQVAVSCAHGASGRTSVCHAVREPPSGDSGTFRPQSLVPRL